MRCSNCCIVRAHSGASTSTGAGGFWSRLTGGNTSTPGRFDICVALRGPDDKSDSDSDADEAADNGGPHSSGGVQWTEVGKVFIQFELLPQALAHERVCGHGQAEPNRFPELPGPVGRMKFSFNPFAMLSALVGPEAMQKICMPFGLCCACAVLAAMLLNPLVLPLLQRVL